MKALTRRSVLGLALPALLALAACGGGSSAGASSPSSQAPASSSAPGTSSSAAAAPAEVTVAYVPIYTAGVLTLAESQGYFKEQNLTVELTPVANPPAALAAVGGGQVQFGYAPSIPVLRAASNGVDLKVAAAADGFSAAAAAADPASTTIVDDTAVVVRKGSTIASVKDLEGKTVSVPARGAQLEVTIASAVKSAGGDPAKVKFVALGLPEATAALKAGRLDAAGLVAPFVATALKDGGKLVIQPAVAFFGEGAVGLWVTSGKYASANADVVKRFQAAMVKANAYAQANLAAFQQAAADITKTPIADVQAGAEPFFPAEVKDTDLSKVADKMVAAGFIAKAPDAASLIVR